MFHIRVVRSELLFTLVSCDEVFVGAPLAPTNHEVETNDDKRKKHPHDDRAPSGFGNHGVLLGKD